jgi:tetratricopeptide (TPR) repeat protein
MKSVVKKQFSFSNKKIIFISIIVLATVIPYINSFETSFQLDDYHTIEVNKEIGNISRFTDLNLWKGIFYNRQLVNLTYTVNYLLNGYDLFGYHLFNLIIHIINSLLVFYLTKYLFESQIVKQSNFYKHKDLIALFTSLIFAVHPIQIQAVTYITQRLVSMAIMFYLICINLYLSARLYPNQKNYLKYFFIVISFVLGIYSKEIIFTLPLSILFIEILFFKNDDNKVAWKYVIPLIVVILIGTAFLIIHIGFPIQPEAPSHYFYFITELTVLVTYIRLLFLPINQHLYYFVQVRENLFDISVIISLSILLLLIYLGIRSYKRNRLISFLIGWFFITQLIESTIFPLKFLLFEYRIYPAVISLGLFLSLSIFSLVKNDKHSVAIMSLIVLVFSLMTFNHNRVWKDPITLWENNVAKTPNYSVAYLNLGKQYMMRNNFQNAFKNFTEAIKLDSNLAEAYAHRTIIFSDNGNYFSAMQDANRAIKLNSKQALFYNNRGYVFQSMKDYDNAINDFRKAIEIEPIYDNAIKNLSIVLFFQNKFLDALAYANRSIELNPHKEEYFNNRGNIYFALGDFQKALKDFRTAFEISPNYSKAVNNIGVVLLRLNNFDDAIKYFTKAIEINNLAVDSYFYRGYAFIQKGLIQNAHYDLTHCLKLAPNHQGAIEMLNQYFRKP